MVEQIGRNLSLPALIAVVLASDEGFVASSSRSPQSKIGQRPIPLEGGGGEDAVEVFSTPIVA